MRSAKVMGLLLLVAGGVRANDEYVNPRFCYRVIQPADVSRVVPRADGTGIAMELGGPCPGPACIAIDIGAGYPRRADVLPHTHRYYQALGWKAGNPARRTVAGTTWTTYPMARQGVAMDVHEHVRRHGEAVYVIVAQYPREARQRVRREVTKLLASWRWVSACI
ncbi:hypothetical protein HBF26_16405 [Luteibacter jiangsuensis]|uniref:Secreted protein n=1 Tax=Luteibacter jiangsuensis TaxID=637577 RepID=A0ABX0QC14_9GAMM|nr:hypothetical protein [Luteibacter jiangsuensis]NID06478.1 hypothetical protein [Luteibacter jiangsuensis]